MTDTPRPGPIQTRPPSARIVHRGSLFNVWSWEQELHNGLTARFEQLSRPDTVLVLPVDERGRVYLARETQPGMQTRLHTIGGRVEPDETPEAAARRELLEEAGFYAERLELWVAWQPQSKLDWAVYIYWAAGLRDSGAVAQDAGESIILQDVDLRELLSGDVAERIDDHELLYQLGLASLSGRARRLLDDRVEAVRRTGRE